jgi:LPXTG-motif cell wall-anchored protein
MWDKSGLADNWLVDNQGYLQKDVDATSLDGTMTINIPLGVKIVDASGNPLTQISVAPIASSVAAPDGYQILKSFNFNPDGAKFDSGMKITVSFDPATVPAGKTVALAFYNETEGKWEFISGTNNGDSTATFEITHFSTYSLMSGITEKTTQTNIAMWVGIAAGILLLLLLAILLMRRRKTAKA